MIGEVRVYDAETKQLKRIEYPDGKVYLVMKNGRLVEPDKEEKEKETTPIEGETP